MKILLGILLLITSVVAAYFSSAWFSPHMQTDEQLRIVFLKHRESFSRLQQFFMDDSSLLYASPQTLYRNNVREAVSGFEPYEGYRSDFERTEILFGGRSGVLDLEFLEFPTYWNKLEGGDFSQQPYEVKGYVLMLSPADKVIAVLGSGKNTYGNAEFKQIEGQWYIYRGIEVSKPE